MPHGAIIGMTTSGQTTLGKYNAASFIKQGIRTLILHKPREPWPKESVWFQTDDPNYYLQIWEKVGAENYEKSQQNCRDPRLVSDACFMELADGIVDKWDDRFHKCFTQGRHDGHRCFYLSQRAASVHPAIRENCESICLFTVPKKAAQLWAEEFCDDFLLKSVTLPRNAFVYKPTRYTPATVKILSGVGTK